jgi:hypothetical protein
VSGVVPKAAVYDDGCHLIKYLHRHIGKDLTATNAAKALAEVKFSVDRIHFRNHVGSWCRANMNPDDNPRMLILVSKFVFDTLTPLSVLQGVNTEAAEQLFSWLKGYASIISSLGWKRASMFLLIIFHQKNLMTTRTKSNAIFNIVSKLHCRNSFL